MWHHRMRDIVRAPTERSESLRLVHDGLPRGSERHRDVFSRCMRHAVQRGLRQLRRDGRERLRDQSQYHRDELRNVHQSLPRGDREHRNVYTRCLRFGLRDGLRELRRGWCVRVFGAAQRLSRLLGHRMRQLLVLPRVRQLQRQHDRRLRVHRAAARESQLQHAVANVRNRVHVSAWFRELQRHRIGWLRDRHLEQLVELRWVRARVHDNRADLLQWIVRVQPVVPEVLRPLSLSLSLVSQRLKRRPLEPPLSPRSS